MNQVIIIEEASANIASSLLLYDLEIDVDLDYYYEDKEKPKEEHCCTGCMDCLGLYWSDFM